MLPVRELTIYAASATHQAQHAQALAAGLEVHGIKTLRTTYGAPSKTKHVACWGWRVGRHLRHAGHEVLVMERGYLGDRFAWTSLGWNGLNGRAVFYPKDDPQRFESHFRMAPWKDGGKYALLIGQVPGDASLAGMNLSRWYEDAATQATKVYGLPVRFRQHPMAAKRNIRQRVMGAEPINGTLDNSMAGAAVCVTYNSNTAVDAVIAGVPTVACDKGTMAAPVCASKIGEIRKPDRDQWAHRLAWCQWTMDEIKSGEAWEAVRPR